MLEIDKLKIRWFNLFQFADDKTIVENTFQDLVQKYSETHRHYHTLEHVDNCLKLFDKVKNLVSDPFSLEVAIWFHDVVYVPLNNNNEEMSAEYSVSFLESVDADTEIVRSVEYLILLTKHPSSPETPDEKFLLDIDLSILGSDKETYDEYEYKVRKEFSSVPDIIFRRGRRKVLESFLSQKSIYQTDYFSKRFELQARENIERVLS